ncbi:uncharacterized protein EI97DRAFT_129598 [Westerdykella ornata]|uniref:DNA2/NAM7 helicase helicase domain-containing protein n=1 Tax=Westerdykella ornata TaxID=318751 RepID=A0A6A6JCU3_WESOR|nr:uncharacterized protein EI97DRAFT_129598 [Westerdykella ornata]KAF2274440.1 hypothetical protein EI97DRAFT_129598 [Westerdykella ornata]
MVFSYQTPERTSPDQISVARERWSDFPTKLEHVLKVIDALMDGLNPEQQEFVGSVLSGGVASCALFLHGCPGSGKTTALAIAILAILGRKTLIVAQSNQAVDVVVSRVLNLVDSVNITFDVEDITQKVVRLYPAAIEDRISRELAAQTCDRVVLEEEEIVLPQEAGLKTASFAYRLEEYCTEHEEDELVQRFRTVREYRANMNKDFSETNQKSYDVVMGYLEKRIFKAALVVGTTTTMSHDLFARGFEADVVVIDEMSKCARACRAGATDISKTGTRSVRRRSQATPTADVLAPWEEPIRRRPATQLRRAMAADVGRVSPTDPPYKELQPMR